LFGAIANATIGSNVPTAHPTPAAVEARVEAQPGAVPAYAIPSDHPAVQAGVRALRAVYPETEPLLVRIGGTLPAVGTAIASTLLYDFFFVEPFYTLRISDATTSGSFGDQTFSPGLSQAAGESAQTHFDASFPSARALSTRTLRSGSPSRSSR